MELFFRQHDGKWSEQTKAAILRHDARGLDLNQNWAFVDRWWMCPVCRRQKDAIFRLSARGILLAKLEEHHDHLRDYVNHRARKLFGEGWLANAPRGAGIVVDRIQDLVSSFSQEMICSDCNSADGAVKATLNGKIHSYFSFAPSQIADFITPHPNAPHDIDFTKAAAAWERLRPSFETRLTLVDTLLKHIPLGTLNYTHGTPWFQVTQRRFDPQSQLHQAFLSATNRDERQRWLSHTVDEFLARSVQKDSPAVAPKHFRSGSPTRVPSRAEYVAYSDPVSPRRWTETAEDWQCPVCERKKPEIIRWSKSGKWSGGVREHFQPVAEADPDSLWARRSLLPGFRNFFVIRDIEIVNICSGCQDVMTQLKQRRQDIRDQFLYARDVRVCLTAVTPHVPHEVEWEELASRVSINRDVGPAWDAYWTHVTMAAEVREQYRHWMASKGYSPEEVTRMVSERVMFDAQLDDQEEAIKLTEWLLRDAEQRIAASAHRREKDLAQKRSTSAEKCRFVSS
jgi:rubredoxin